MKITQITTAKNIKTLAALAFEIWHEYFPSILSQEQIDYMVEKFQSEKAITEQLKSGYQYYFIENAGYLGYQIQSDKLFLSKLYIEKSKRGKGYARVAFEFLKDICEKQKLNSIYLTVNKYNTNAINIYQKFGFNKTNSVVTDIGNNFVMDDFIFEFYIQK